MDDPHTSRRRFLRWLLASAALGIPVPGEAVPKVGERPGRTVLGDLAGARITLPDTYGGMILVVHFWASWCPSCLREIDALESLFAEEGRRGVKPVSVNVGETEAMVKDALRSRRVTYPILLDPDSTTARSYGVAGFPTTFILDRTGTVVRKVLGEIDREGLRRMLTGVR